MKNNKKIVESKVDEIIEDKTCNCKKSECLKLYCECFSNGIYCSTGKIRCNCNSCHNLPAYEKKRKAAINATLERNPYAFRQKGQQNNVVSILYILLYRFCFHFIFVIFYSFFHRIMLR
jgi:hypothetical protein